MKLKIETYKQGEGDYFLVVDARSLKKGISRKQAEKLAKIIRKAEKDL